MKPKINYTQSGEEEIHRYLDEQKEILEKYILQEKYIIGDEIIEITGSDIVKTKQELRVSYRKTKSTSSTLKLASFLYGIIGVLLTIAGFLYPEVKHIMEYNTQQAMLILIGLAISLAGVFLGIFVKYQEKRERENRYRKELMDTCA